MGKSPSFIPPSSDLESILVESEGNQLPSTAPITPKKPTPFVSKEQEGINGTWLFEKVIEYRADRKGRYVPTTIKEEYKEQLTALSKAAGIPLQMLLNNILFELLNVNGSVCILDSLIDYVKEQGTKTLKTLRP